MSNVNPLHPRSVRFAERAQGHDAIERILVVVDPIATRHPCIEKAARLASGFGSTIELYSCDVEQDMPVSWAGGTTLAQFRGLMRERRIGALEVLAAPLRARGLHVKTESECRAPFEQAVVEHAIRTGADLVVKDIQRQALARRSPIVETDPVLIRELPMPFLLVRSRPWGANPVIAASVDPCHVAERPVELDRSLVALASSVGRAVSGAVTILHALQGMPHFPGENVSVEQQNDHCQCHRARVMSLAEGENIDAAHVSFGTHPAPEGIVQLAIQARPAVLVMGVAARQRSQGGAISTASQMLERTDCDLMVVKPPGFVSPALVTGA